MTQLVTQTPTATVTPYYRIVGRNPRAANRQDTFATARDADEAAAYAQDATRDGWQGVAVRDESTPDAGGEEDYTPLCDLYDDDDEATAYRAFSAGEYIDSCDDLNLLLSAAGDYARSTNQDVALWRGSRLIAVVLRDGQCLLMPCLIAA